MKTKITMLIALILIATTGIYAQGMQRKTVPERVKETMDKITPSLKLTDSQLSPVNTAFTEYYTAQMKMFQDAQESGQRPERSDFEKLTEKRDTKLKTIFSADQFTKFKEDEAAMRAQRQRQ
ncbi:MAG: hypothetical protein ABI123_08390 [Ginsengibacter sp.]|jgi:hypothetical protein